MCECVPVAGFAVRWEYWSSNSLAMIGNTSWPTGWRFCPLRLEQPTRKWSQFINKSKLIANAMSMPPRRLPKVDLD